MGCHRRVPMAHKSLRRLGDPASGIGPVDPAAHATILTSDVLAHRGCVALVGQRAALPSSTFGSAETISCRIAAAPSGRDMPARLVVEQADPQGNFCRCQMFLGFISAG
jgi:hypothetical protein